MKTSKKEANLLSFAILLIISTITFSCDSFKLEHFVDDETKSYCYFENGIQYVYFDSVSGIVDTVYLNEKWDISTKGEPSHPGQIISSSSVGIDEETASMWISCEPIGDPFSEPIESYSWAIFLARNWNVAAYYSSQYSGCGTDSTFFQELIPEYQLGDIVYQDVKKFYREITHRDSLGYFKECFYFYWAKDVGLIKLLQYSRNDSIQTNINLIGYEISD